MRSISTPRPTPRRALRRAVREVLEAENFAADVEELRRMPRVKVLNALFGFLSHGKASIRQRAAEALGTLVAAAADADPEGARGVMRRLIWGMTEESGNVIWGAPEAMGEAVARHRGLAREYAPLLLSFIAEDGNYLEHEPLLCGAVRAVIRVEEAWPGMLGELGAGFHLERLRQSDDRALRELAEAALRLISLDLDSADVL